MRTFTVMPLFLLALCAVATGGWHQVSRSPSETYLDVFFVDAKTGWASSWGGGIFKTTDGGQSWSRQESGEKYEWMNSIYFTDASSGWIAGGDGRIYSTKNGGITWEKNSFEGAGFEGICFADSHGWLVGKGGGIMHTDDGGRSWNPQHSGVDKLLMDIHFPDARTGYAVGIEGIVLKTTDGGRSWRKLDAGTSALLYAVRFVSPEHGWIGGRNGVLLVTENGGKNWQPAWQGSEEEIDDIFFIDAEHGWAVGGSVQNGQFILNTVDGKTWRRQDVEAVNWWECVHFIDKDVGYIGGNNGVIMKTVDGGR
ncbi:hypothetical protein JW905_13195 [bacterium]|nr:hypothetical protein [candidate division CSSED10-310 bacterium]